MFLSSLVQSLVISLSYTGRFITDNGRAKISYRARLNRAVNSSASRVTFRSLGLDHAHAMNARRVRCEVFAENSGITGRACFN